MNARASAQIDNVTKHDFFAANVTIKATFVERDMSLGILLSRPSKTEDASPLKLTTVVESRKRKSDSDEGIRTANLQNWSLIQCH
jgi:hypothetical protein